MTPSSASADHIRYSFYYTQKTKEEGVQKCRIEVIVELKPEKILKSMNVECSDYRGRIYQLEKMKRILARLKAFAKDDSVVQEALEKIPEPVQEPDEVAYLGNRAFTFKGSVDEAQTSASPESFVRGDIGQGAAVDVTTKPGGGQDTGIRAQARLAEGEEITGAIGEKGKKVASKQKFYASDAQGVYPLAPSNVGSSVIERKYLDNEQAGKFIKAVTTAYNDAHRFIYGMSLISGVNYMPYDRNSPPDHFLNVITQKVEKFRDEVDQHRIIKTWDGDKFAPDSRGRKSNREKEFGMLRKFFSGSTSQKMSEDDSTSIVSDCPELQLPYVLRYAGKNFRFADDPNNNPGDIFFWLQYKFKVKPSGSSDGETQSACAYDKDRRPIEIKVVGIGIDSPYYAGVFEFPKSITNGNEGVELSESLIDQKLAQISVFDSSHINFSGGVFKGDKSPRYYRVAQFPGDAEELVSFNLDAIDRQTNLSMADTWGAIGGGSASISQDNRMWILDTWLKTGLRLNEILWLYFLTKNTSMLEHVRGLFPIASLNGRRDKPNGGNYEYELPMAPLYKKILPERRLLKGPQYYAGSRNPHQLFSFENWILYALYHPFTVGPENAGKHFSVPLVGGIFELVSLMIFNQLADENKLFLHTRNAEAMRTHALKVVNLIPAFRIYQTQFSGKFNSIEVALRDRKDLSKVATSEEDFVTLGLIPQRKTGTVKEDEFKTESLATGFTIEPVALAHRGLAQVWKVHRPAGFPESAGDPSAVNLNELLNTETAESGSMPIQGVKWHTDAETSKKYMETPTPDDPIHSGFKNYKSWAQKYKTTELGSHVVDSPLAIDAVEVVKNGDPKTFFGKITQFETKLYEGALGVYRDGGSGPDNQEGPVVTALQNLSGALSDGQAIWMMYPQDPGTGLSKNLGLTDDNVIYKINIRKINFNNPLALNSLLSVDPNEPYGLIIPPIYAPILNRAASYIYTRTMLQGTESVEADNDGFELHYYDVLWVEHPTSLPATVGETFTGADLVALTLRFNMLMMYLMTFVCLNESSFNDMIKGFHVAMGEDYEELLGKVAPKSKKEGKSDKVLDDLKRSIALMIKKIEDNRQVVMDQCWATPFIPLRAFRFRAQGGYVTNVDQVIHETIQQAGLSEQWESLSPGFGSGFDVDRLQGPKIAMATNEETVNRSGSTTTAATSMEAVGSTSEKTAGKCGLGGYMNYLTFGAKGNPNCPMWVTGMQIFTSLIFVVAMIYILANLGVFGKKAKQKIVDKKKH